MNSGLCLVIEFINPAHSIICSLDGMVFRTFYMIPQNGIIHQSAKKVHILTAFLPSFKIIPTWYLIWTPPKQTIDAI